ncbi:lipoate--protein ligase family protein [Argonema antarcticum]|uniref:lipoate--protein ligase family protein n=1 Tax=Argonema antarcticum TaxID=2942763 RepID=UPI00201272AF|nr:lipoate--protein ligase family protein [Argonema antarcticum]MCL1469724.1 lipoate--protein ligase family protein [Argonema antarcticum A004/B2]
MTNSWRLIPLLSAPGRVQMAIDLWLLEQHSKGLHPPALRFYTWSPPAISLGYHQRRWPEFWQHLTWQGQQVELVRRPSGGRAVLHQGDLTYAVVTSGLTGSRTQVYQTLCEFLIAGWLKLGVELHYGNAGRGYIHNPNCFGTATGADLVSANNCKLIGSAQLCRGNAILQHGSMRLQPDDALFAQVFDSAAPPPVDIPIPDRTEALIQSVVDALSVAASRCFDAQLVIQPLSEAEWQAILTLRALID